MYLYSSKNILTAKSSQWDIRDTYLHQTIHYLHHAKTIPLLVFFKGKEERAWPVISDAPRHGMKGMAMHLSTLMHTISSTHYSAYSKSFFLFSPLSILLPIPELYFYPFSRPVLLSVIISLGFYFFFRVFLSHSMLCNLLYRIHVIHVKMSEFHSVIRTTLNMFLNIVFSILNTIEFFSHTSMTIFFFMCLWKTNS